MSVSPCRDSLSIRKDGQQDVVVVGAGIAGLGLACALSGYGLRVLLLERRKHTGGIHRGDSLLPKTTEILQRWGVLEAIQRAGAQPIDTLSIHHHRRGLVSEGPLGVPGERTPYLVLPHAQIEAVLQSKAEARGVTILRPARVTGVLRKDERVFGVRYEAGGETHEAHARLVVAADGGKSIVRQALGITATPHVYDHAYLGLEAQRPAAYRNAMHLCLHPDGGVLLMPRSLGPDGDDRIGVGVLVEANSAEHWLTLPTEELSSVLSARAPLLEGMTLFRQGSHVYTLRRVHADRYQAQGAVILGDAAHGTNPTAGQGMSMAIADAGVLADHVGPALARGEADLRAHLLRYESAQWPVNEMLVRRSHRLAQLYALRGPTWDWLKVGLIQLLASPVGQRVAAPLQRMFLASQGSVAESASVGAPDERFDPLPTDPEVVRPC